jgi:hypothetical protein
MGLFSSPKPPQPLLPAFAIQILAAVDKVFRPDDIVTGHIIFVPVTPITPHGIEVSLFGQTLIWYRTSHSTGHNSTEYHHWRDCAPLFEVTTNVLPVQDSKAPPLEVGKTYTFPFSFRFPAGTGNSRIGQYQNDHDVRWTTGPHPLPPSFLNPDSHKGGEDADYAKVEYGVRARLLCPGVGVMQGSTFQDLVVTAPVLFVPLNPRPYTLGDSMSVLKYPKSFAVQTSALTGQAPSSIGFRQSILDRISSSTPRLAFETALEIPDFLTSGSEFRFRASFNVVSKTDNVTHIPAISFKVLKLELKEITCVRARRDLEASGMSDGHHFESNYFHMPAAIVPVFHQEHIDTSKRKKHLNSLPELATVELGDLETTDEKNKNKRIVQANRCETWFTARVPGFTPPSFKSFAINRSYKLKITLGVEVAGKWFEQEVESDVKEIWSMPT